MPTVVSVSHSGSGNDLSTFTLENNDILVEWECSLSAGSHPQQGPSTANFAIRRTGGADVVYRSHEGGGTSTYDGEVTLDEGDYEIEVWHSGNNSRDITASGSATFDDSIDPTEVEGAVSFLGTGSLILSPVIISWIAGAVAFSGGSNVVIEGYWKRGGEVNLVGKTIFDLLVGVSYGNSLVFQGSSQVMFEALKQVLGILESVGVGTLAISGSLAELPPGPILEVEQIGEEVYLTWRFE